MLREKFLALSKKVLGKLSCSFVLFVQIAHAQNSDENREKAYKLFQQSAERGNRQAQVFIELINNNNFLEEENIYLKQEVEHLKEEKSLVTLNKLNVVVEICSMNFLHAICTPVVHDYIYVISKTSEQTTKEYKKSCFDLDFNEVWTKLIIDDFDSLENIVVDKKGSTYFASKNKNIYLLKQAGKKRLFDEKKYSHPSLGQNGLLYVASQNADLFCFDPTAEIEVWKVNTDADKIWPYPAVDNEGAAYFASESTLYIVSPTGDVDEKPLSVPIASPIKIGPYGNLYFLSDASTLTSIDPDGNFRWNYRIYPFSATSSPDITCPAFDLDGHVYVGSSNGKIYCIAAKNGHWKWQRAVKNNSPIRLNPTSNERGEVFFLSEDGTLYRKRTLGFFHKLFFGWWHAYHVD